ncbi:MAG: DUF1838 family protein [Steroidobacteraceae bacterium]
MTDELTDPARRAWLGGSLALGLAGAGALLPEPAAAAGRGLPDFADPAVNLRELVRLQGSLQEQDVPWWFTGVIFAIAGEGETPRPLVRFEGMEIYWFAHRGAGYQLGGNTVTFFRDFETQEFLHELRNPWTGRTDAVRPAVQGGNLGFSYTTEGIWPVRLGGEPLAPPQPAPLRLQWHAIGEHVWLQHQTVYPPGMPPMHGQRQSLFASRRDVLDRRLDALPATFSSTVFMGWPKWMDMQDRPGHVVWHAAGAKLRGVAELPREYLERASREFPERLSARPKSSAPA